MDKRRARACALLLAFALCTAALLPGATARAGENAPVADNLELTTYRNVSVGGRLSAVDPDGDTLTFEITTAPTKGELELTEDGRFVYTPDTNRRGRDYFGYKAVDAEGNRSQEATVIIRIVKQKSAPTYRDMAGHAAGYAAALLAEEGVFTGERLGECWFFRPDEPVARGDFLAMCLELADTKLLAGVAATGFLDDAEIAAWQKPYVATALMDGVISGYGAGGGAVFSAGAAITCSEAAVILDNVLALADVSASGLDAAAPTWAAQAVGNLSACGALPDGCAYDAALTRADAARMLAAALEARAGD